MTKTPAQHYYASAGELSHDRGLIGQVLRSYQDILPAADKWGEQNFAYRKKKEDPNRLPLPDPWQFLLDAPAVSPMDKAVFRSAQSQFLALRHLIHMNVGIATLNTDWYQKALDAQTREDRGAYSHAISKLAREHVLHEIPQECVRKQNDPELLKQMELLLKHHIHRGGEKGTQARHAKQWPSWKEFRKHNGLPVALVERWVRCEPNGLPGLMFWRNAALTKFLQVHLDQTPLDPDGVKKVRRKLGLIPVGEKRHFVWDVAIGICRDGSREIKGYRRNGQQCFCGVISPQKQISEAVLLAVR